MAHQAWTYPVLCSIKRLGVFLLPPGWDASPLQGYPPSIKFTSTHFHSWVKRYMYWARALTQITWSRDQHTNHRPLCPHHRPLCTTVLSPYLSPPRSEVFKWVPINCWGNLTNCGGVSCDELHVASSPGEVEILLAASFCRNQDKLRQLRNISTRLRFSKVLVIH